MPSATTTRKRTTKPAAKKTANRTGRAGKKAVRSTKVTAKKTAKKAARKTVKKGSAAKRATARKTNPVRKAVRKRSTAPARRGRSSSQPADAVALIKADHAAVNDLFKRYRAAGKSAYKAKRSLAERIVRELSIHAAIEEQILYPAVRRVVPNGKRLVEEALSEHQELKQTLTSLDKLPAEDERFDPTMRKVIDEVRHHVREEESGEGMLTRLRKRADRQDLVEMARTLRTAKKAAPTRPHPNAPQTPPGNIVVGAAAAIVDKARDAVRGR